MQSRLIRSATDSPRRFFASLTLRAGAAPKIPSYAESALGSIVDDGVGRRTARCVAGGVGLGSATVLTGLGVGATLQVIENSKRTPEAAVSPNGGTITDGSDSS
jgi:hypothetical protein